MALGVMLCRAAFWGTAPARPHRAVIAAAATAIQGFGDSGPSTAKIGVMVYMIATTRTLASSFFLPSHWVRAAPTTRPSSEAKMLDQPITWPACWAVQ